MKQNFFLQKMKSNESFDANVRQAKTHLYTKTADYCTNNKIASSFFFFQMSLLVCDLMIELSKLIQR